MAFKNCYMKRMIGIRDKFAALLLLLLSGGYSFAQGSVDGYTSVYDTTAPKHDYVQFIGPGIMLALVIYVGYRYWHDNHGGDKHTTHHQ